MKNHLLLPSYFKYPGYLLAVSGLALGCFFEFNNFTFKFLSNGHRRSLFGGNENYTDELAITLITVGLFFVGFSINRLEDEKVSAYRLKALYWSVVAASAISLFLIIFNLLTVVAKGTLAIPLYFFLYQPVVYILLFIYFLSSQKNMNQESTPPLKYKPFHLAGFFLVAICVLIRLIYGCINLNNENILTAVYFAATISLLILFISKEKTESTLVSVCRGRSLQISIYITVLVFLVITWLVYGFDYLGYLYTYPLYLLLTYFVIFQFELYRNRRRIHQVIA